MTQAQFETVLDRFDTKSRELFNKQIRRLAGNIDKALVTESPVADPSTWSTSNADGSPIDHIGGQYRRNWGVTVGLIDTHFIKGNIKSHADRDAKAEATILGWTAGQNLHLTNPSPYARRIEFGWSHQKSRGWGARIVRREVARVRRGGKL